MSTNPLVPFAGSRPSTAEPTSIDASNGDRIGAPINPSADLDRNQSETETHASAERPVSNLENALRLASAGLYVFPCKPNKAPACKWKQASTNVPERVRELWRSCPEGIAAIDMGKSGLFGIDCDRHGDGPDGVNAFRKIVDELGLDVSRVPAVRTPSGGMHFYFRQDGNGEGAALLGNSPGALPAGIDVRGDGGYLIAPGATLPDGRAYKKYKEYPDLVAAFLAGPLEVVPDGLAEVIKRKRSESTTLASDASFSKPLGGKAGGSAETFHARGALELLCDGLAATPPGERNTKTNDAAFALGRMIGAGWIDRPAVETRILAACEANGSIKDDGAEKVRGTIASGLNAGIKSPHPPLSANVGAGVSVNFDEMAARVTATPYTGVDPSTLPLRQWIYNNHYIGKFISATIAPGGVGKSSLAIAEVLSIATGRSLLGIKPRRSVKVWLWNGEDPPDELVRRVAAVAMHFRLDPREYEGRLFLDSGRSTPIILVDQQKNGTRIAHPVVDKLIALIKELEIGLLIIDPFVASHRVTENDNNAINLVAQIWSQIAEATGCAIELVHHARKTGGAEIAVEDGRGASALVAAARSVRVLNPMSEADANKGGVDADQRRSYFRVDNGKANLAPPAEKSEWYQIVSVPLGNGPDEMDPDGSGDSIGVVTPWEFVVEELALTKLEEADVCAALGSFPHNYNVNGKPWAGSAIAKALGREDDEKQLRAPLKAVLDDMIKRGLLEKSEEKDPRDRKEKTFVRPNKAKVPL